MPRPDDSFELSVQRRGRALIINLSILARLADIYSSSNDAVTNAAERFLSDLREIMSDLGEVTVKMASESFFVEDMRVKATKADLDNFAALIKTLDDRGVGSLTFRSSLDAPTIIDCMYALVRGEDLAGIQAALDAASDGAMAVDAAQAARDDSDVDLRDTRLVARRAYAKAVAALVDIHRTLTAGKSLNVKRAKRAVQSLVDSIAKDEPYVLALTTRRKRDHYYFLHCINVAVMAMALGRRLGIDKYAQSRLGMAAIFHDVGLSEEKVEYLAGRSDLSPDEINMLEEHPVEGVRLLLRSRGLNEVSMLSMLIAYEHHMNLDMLGYPRPLKMWNPKVLSRIVRIVDEYDTLLSRKVFGQENFTHEHVLSIMHANARNAYDPQLFGLFLNMIGSA